MSISSRPFFSVVIPTRDRKTLLLDALKGLESQQMDHNLYDVIVVDNGSSDGTFEYLSERINDYSFTLKIIKNPDCEKGPAPARNLGVNIASGKVIAFLDSDCRPHEDWLKNAYSVFVQHPTLDFATGVIDFKPEQRDELGFFSRKTVIALSEHPTYPTANTFYKKDVFINADGFNTELSFPNIFGQSVEAADTDLAWRIRDAGAEYRFIDSAIVYHEVQTLHPKEWILEPARLFLLPALVKKHPRLRSELLTGNLIFYPRSIFYYLLILLSPLLLFFPVGLITALLTLWILFAIFKARSISPKKFIQAGKEIVLNTCKNLVMCFALIVGSIKYRSLVL